MQAQAPLIVGAGGIRTKLEPTGPAIGLFPNVVHEVKIIEILPDELLVAYTGGATDAKNDAGEQFLEATLLALVAKGALTGGAMVHQIVATVEAFIGGTVQYDDITVIAASRGSIE